ncbi:MAG: glycerol-3-phosphate acyltransferase, partial [Alphaproteobacteria bacterium]|nr:glycerol-3-phosphate acyltransferase [Alphaproteobacteria bacterium]
FLGALLGIAWPAAFAFAAIWLTVAFATRYSSVAALAATAFSPIILQARGESAAALVFSLMAVLLFAKHKANIERLLAGTESKIGSK